MGKKISFVSSKNRGITLDMLVVKDFFRVNDEKVEFKDVVANENAKNSLVEKGNISIRKEYCKNNTDIICVDGSIAGKLPKNAPEGKRVLIATPYDYQFKAINEYELVKEGDCIAVMDCDLQHPPETLIKMYRLWEDGYQVIEGVKASRGRESFIHKMFAKTFYSIISDATGIDMSRASDFKLMDRQAAEEFLKLPERNVFFRALSSWVGFKTTYVEFDVQEREAGESKWSFKSLVRYAVNNITSFSAAPMQIVTFFGVVFFVFAVLLGIQSLYMYFSGHAVAGFTTVILLLLLVGSILMFSLGVIGYYIAKIYDEVKMRPRYIISEVIKSKE